MKKLKNSTFFLLILALSGCFTFSPSESDYSFLVDGEFWDLKYRINNKNTHIRILFKSDGTFASFNPNGSVYSNEKELEEWYFEEDMLIFSFNDSYAVYAGYFQGSKMVVGMAKNQKGTTWEWVLTKDS